MPDLLTRLEVEDLKENLREVQELLHRHALVEGLQNQDCMARPSNGPNWEEWGLRKPSKGNDTAFKET